MAYKEKLLNDGDILYAEHLNNMMRGISESVSYTEQKLTEEQKAQARENIGAASDGDTVSIDMPSRLTIEDGTEYHLTNVSNLTITYPNGLFECYIYLSTGTGEITVIFPESKYIGSAPSFGSEEEWEISIKNGVIASGQVVSA